MTFDQFITKHNGKGIDFDGAYGDQCMDLMHVYIVEVLGLPDPRILAAPVARSVYENFPNVFGNQYFERIPNTPNGVPQKGDIMFWKEPYGYYYNTSTKRNEYAGHVGININSDVKVIRAFEQNNPTGTKCHTQIHNDSYKGVLGWLRFKKPQVQDAEKLASEKMNKVYALRDVPGTNLEKVPQAIAILTK